MDKRDIQRRRNVALSDWYVARAAKIGAGSVSRGIRIAIDDRGVMRHAIKKALAARDWSALTDLLAGES